MAVVMNKIPVGKPKIRLVYGDEYKFVQKVVHTNKLNTVCEEARCPNIYECWGRGTATIMILGDTCTRSCGFCSVNTGKPNSVDEFEPFRTAMAVKKMNLRHVVITSVDRDDLKGDFGARIWAETIRQIHQNVPSLSRYYYLSSTFSIIIQICSNKVLTIVNYQAVLIFFTQKKIYISYKNLKNADLATKQY